MPRRSTASPPDPSLNLRRDANVVGADEYPRYDNVRITTAIEASDHLDTVVERLTAMVGAPRPRAFTLTFTGSTPHEDTAPTSFVVTALTLDSALQTLAVLPTWGKWLESAGTEDPVHLPQQSHEGLPAHDRFTDLRGEQHPALTPSSTSRPAGTVIGSRPASAAATAAARTSR
ncbi:hypothetical protein GTY81_20080 [Streptomyces sp. SID8366]|uniref:hypothetical protein n=1 Tax=unclassified Streptomyces TaxID=2593676 RepID=UPI000DC4C36B|nr:hypothetical protein [Streptomyces sp. PsTaAH-130]MYU06133.1 hypothetical protein [Streptomyces sp. SID8366]MYU61706.1 hypothetical protein [Streptomyces sp. SID69]RAJ64204.1 hypothetical protein K376_01301 [Streptomyces sp. PsTaAH-130]